jgi:hypothetical protein
MDSEKKESIIHQITAGEYIVDCRDRTFIFKEPTKSLLIIGLTKREQIRKECSTAGYITIEQEQKMLFDNFIWSEEDDQKLELLVNDIKTFRKNKKQYQFQSLKVAQLDAMIKQAEEESMKLLSLKNTYHYQTLNYQTELLYNQWILHQCLYDIDGNKIWNTQDDFDNEVDAQLISDLIRSIFYTGTFSEKSIREIARSEPWRTRWKTSQKTGESLFYTPVGFQSKMQHNLCYWSLLYDAILDNPDCPSYDVLNNDELLNEWLLDKQEEHESKTKNPKNAPVSNNPKIANAQEVFVMVNTPEDARKVYNNLNTPDSRRRLRTRQQLLREKGRVKEYEMPDTQLFLRTEANRLAADTIKAKK